MLPLPLVFWASHRRFMYQSNFVKFFSFDHGNTFTVGNTPVRVLLKSGPALTEELSTCHACADQLNRSGLLNLVQAVNWCLEYDLRALVSSFGNVHVDVGDLYCQAL